MLRGLNEITKRVKQPNEMNLNWLSLNSWGPMSLHGPGARAICMLDMISVISNYVCCITVVCIHFSFSVWKQRIQLLRSRRFFQCSQEPLGKFMPLTAKT